MRREKGNMQGKQKVEEGMLMLMISAVVSNSLKVKKNYLSWVWWHRPVVPASWEAEAGGSLEPRKCQDYISLEPWKRPGGCSKPR